MRTLATVLLAAALLAHGAAAQTIKLATLVPEGTVWDKALRQMDAEWKRATEGRVQLRIYPGGVAGDEPDIVRKLRIGQIQAASLTTSGLGMLDEGFKVFNIPLFYESEAEVRDALDALTPMLSKRLEAKGYVLLNWGHTGWIHFFTTKPARTLDELRKLKMFVWAGDENMLRWWRQSDFTAVPLAATDILTGLQTGMIEALPSTPLAALSLQWFRSAPYMIESGVLPFLAGTVVSKRVWDSLPAASKPALLDAAKAAEEFLLTEVPRQEAQAIEEMKQRGLIVVGAGGSEGITPFRDLALVFADKMKSSEIPSEVLEAARRARDAFRARAARPGDSD